MKSLLISKNSPTNLQHSRLATDLHIPINSAQIKKIFIQKLEKIYKIIFFFKNIWSIQKKAVPLRSVLKRTKSS